MFKFREITKTYWLFVSITLLPFIFSLIWQRQREEDFIYIFLNCAFLIFPLYFINKKRPYLIVVSILLFIPALFDLAHIFLYQGRVTRSLFFILFDTTPRESLEYIESNFRWDLLGALVLYSSLIIFLIKKRLNDTKIEFKMKWYFFFIIFILAPFSFKFYKTKGNINKTLDTYVRANHLLSTYKHYKAYKKEITLFEELSKQLVTNIEVDERPNAPKKELNVLVIGESTTSQHMSLYGYARKTTPYLDSLKENTFVFTDIVCSNPPGTLANLKKIMTLANDEKEDQASLSISLVNIMKAAKFKTYWISNQITLSQNSTMTTVFAKQAHNVQFTNTTNSVSYDEKVLNPLNRYLEEPGDKKFIIIHLLGSHMKYRNRYPDSYNTFKNNEGIVKQPFHNDEKIQYINDYDNSILYGDFIFSKIHKAIKNQNISSTVTFLSDHGEEVYASKDFHGHPGGTETVNMMRIPLVIWSSKPRDFGQYLSRKYVSDDILHSLLDLYGINFEFKNETKSILSPRFKEKKRFASKLGI